MTYNVHGCRGRDREWSPMRVAEVISTASPDIVALQELDVGRMRSGHIDQAEAIALALGMSFDFFPWVEVLEERYGDAILTRYPSRLVKAEALPGLRRREPRGALWTAIEIGGATLQVVNTHLGLLGRERHAQVDALLGPDWLGHPDCRDPVVLLGDFNAPPRSRTYRKLTERFADAVAGKAAQATFPSRFPALRLDYIFTSRAIGIHSARVLRTPVAREASDHLPVIADLDVPGAGIAMQEAS